VPIRVEDGHVRVGADLDAAFVREAEQVGWGLGGHANHFGGW
jgi:hypothetical protein